MKTLTVSMLVLALLVGPVALAKEGSDDVRTERSKKTTVATNVDISCVGKAVDVRETALITAWSTFNTSVTTILSARKTALISAWSLTDAQARRDAVKTAWATAKKDRKAAALTYKTERKNVWATFKTSAKACGGTDGSEGSKESDSKETVEI